MLRRRWVQALMLLLLGFYLLDNIVSGHIYIYVNRFGWITWFSAAGFLLLGVINIVDLLRERPAVDEYAMQDEGEEHGLNEDPKGENDASRTLSWLGLAIFVFPVVMTVIA